MEQLIPLPPDFGGLLVILPRPRRQGLERPLGLIRMLIGLGLPQSETVRLLDKGSQLGYPLLCGNELGGHIPAQPRLFDKAVLVLLLLAKELGFLPATSDKGLKGGDGQNTKKYIEKEKGKKQDQANT